MAKIPVGLQLYTLREETAADFLGTLEKVAALGYKTVEFAGYGSIPAKEMKQALTDLGLTTHSSHVGLPLNDRVKLQSELGKQIDYMLELGSQYFVTPYAPIEQMKTEQEFAEFIDTLTLIAKEVQRNGLKYCYHNHAFEFAKKGDQYLLDYMYDKMGPDLMMAELDLYWVRKAGLDPLSYLQTLKDRCPIIHVKDMTADDRGYFAEVGHGIIDYKAILAAAPALGVKHYIVEQDSCERPPLESIAMSINYLKSIGIA